MEAEFRFSAQEATGHADKVLPATIDLVNRNDKSWLSGSKLKMARAVTSRDCGCPCWSKGKTY